MVDAVLRDHSTRADLQAMLAWCARRRLEGGDENALANIAEMIRERAAMLGIAL